uniref:Glyco_transf_20 domain-containing protein n=1 Tax=Heterorhabditis bacteriophora TaxID=37862 RepID=A0A1I7WRC8_HETBA
MEAYSASPLIVELTKTCLNMLQNFAFFSRAAVPFLFDSDLSKGTKYRDALLFSLTLYDVNTGKNRLRCENAKKTGSFFNNLRQFMGNKTFSPRKSRESSIHSDSEDEDFSRISCGGLANNHFQFVDIHIYFLNSSLLFKGRHNSIHLNCHIIFICQDFIWIHDYHLMLTGMIMQSLDPNLEVGFFLHIPFQPPENFFSKYGSCGMPMLRGLLRFTKVGFQTHRDRAKYVELVQQHLKGISVNYDKNLDIHTGQHQKTINVYPKQKLWVLILWMVDVFFLENYPKFANFLLKRIVHNKDIIIVKYIDRNAG